MDRGIEDETVNAPVPRDVDESDETPLPIRTEIHQTTLQDGIPVTRRVPAPPRCEQLVELLRADRRIDAIHDVIFLPISCQASYFATHGLLTRRSHLGAGRAACTWRERSGRSFPPRSLWSL